MWFNQVIQKLIYPVVYSLLFIASCGVYVNTPNPSKKAVRYLALGDSYTIGENVAESERWPNQLAGMLLAEKDMQAEVGIIARTGWTTSELWEGIQADPPQRTFDLVSLLIGVNNQYRGYGVEQYREEFRFLLTKAIEYAGGVIGRVMVLSIPDWGVTPFAADRDSAQIANAIDAFNSVNREETESAGARYVDVTPISRDHISLIAGDGLHPSGKMYKMWAEKALPVAVESLIKK